MLTCASVSEKGSREINEDFCGTLKGENSGCFVLADGLGGHGKGEIASKLVVETALREFALSHGSGELGDIFDRCQEKLLKLQDRIHDRQSMKTTIVLCHIAEKYIQWGHVGDSRLYYFAKDRLYARTIDHSVPQMLVFAGEIKEREIRFHPDRNRLLKVMGTEWAAPAYEIEEPIERHGKQAFLLCTDGFWEWINEKQMVKCLRKAGNVNEWIELMTEIVVKNGSKEDMDNFTAMCIWSE